MFDIAAPYIIAGLMVATGYLFTRWLAAVGVAKQWRKLAHEIDASAIEQIDAMRAEGCAAIGLVQNVFNGLTSPAAMVHGVGTITQQDMADACAKLLTEATRCEHKERAEEAEEALEAEVSDVHMLCGIASEVYDTITRGRISKPNTEAFEILSVVDELATEERNEAFEEGRSEAEEWEDTATNLLHRAEEAERLLGLVNDRLVVKESYDAQADEKLQ